MSEKQVKLSFKSIVEICNRLPIGSIPKTVTLFGGEPLLPETKDAVEVAVEQAASYGMSINVVTNGYFYQLFSYLFSEVCKKTPITFLVSLDGDRYA